MSTWTVEVTRTVRLVVDAPDEENAQVTALDCAWQWLPGNADRCDQGSATAHVVRLVEL